MATEYERARACEVVGVFHSPEDLESAIDELLSSGFDRAELSLLASENAVAEKLGGHYPPASEMADDPAVPRTAFVSTAAIGDAEGGLIGGLAYVGATVAVGAVVMSGGTLAATIAAAILAGGTGGLIGSALAHWVGHHHAAYLHDQIENGGLLLWVRAWNESDEARALEIVAKHAADTVHSHSIPSSRPDFCQVDGPRGPFIASTAAARQVRGRGSRQSSEAGSTRDQKEQV
jgi:hypothetical protein